MAFDKIRDPRKILHQEGYMEADYIYTAGIAGERFFATLRDEGKFLATRCDKCNITYLPPRIYCQKCFAKTDKWLQVPHTGTVDTYTIVHYDRNGEALTNPVAIAFIRIDNTDGGLIHKIGGVELKKVVLGMRVEAV